MNGREPASTWGSGRALKSGDFGLPTTSSGPKEVVELTEPQAEKGF